MKLYQSALVYVSTENHESKLDFLMRDNKNKQK